MLRCIKFIGKHTICTNFIWAGSESEKKSRITCFTGKPVRERKRESSMKSMRLREKERRDKARIYLLFT